MDYLKKVIYQLPRTDESMRDSLLTLLSPLGTVREGKILFNISHPDFLPQTTIEFTDVSKPQVLFTSDSFEYKVALENTTGVTKESPHEYSPVSAKEAQIRLANIKLTGMDHTGFNLPYFEGIHPEILKLRELLKDKCLYHNFPRELADEPWDFIIPGDAEEISSSKAVDYHTTRKPKIEIVSFQKASTPLIQIDIQTNAKHENLLILFPEAIDDSAVKSVWVYLENKYGIDICLVLNEESQGDWSFRFQKTRVV